MSTATPVVAHKAEYNLFAIQRTDRTCEKCVLIHGSYRALVGQTPIFHFDPTSVPCLVGIFPCSLSSELTAGSIYIGTESSANGSIHAHTAEPVHKSFGITRLQRAAFYVIKRNNINVAAYGLHQPGQQFCLLR